MGIIVSDLFSIAIDGPVASGKTTVGRLLAHKIGFQYIDTGLMYRAVTWVAISKNLDIPICLWDERLSTVGAFNLSGQLDTNVSKRVKNIDQNAAAFILQGALDFINN